MTHPLKEDLYELAVGNRGFFDWLQAGSLDGVWYWDLIDMNREWYSDEFIRLLGFTPGEVEHTPAFWRGQIFEEDLPLALENYTKHEADPSYPYDQVVRYRHKNGSTVWVRCRGLIIRDDSGVPYRMLGAHTDVSDLKRTEERLLESNEDLELVAYAASHDLQQPLRTISSYIEVFCEDFADVVEQNEDAARYIQYILNASNHLRGLVEGLLDYSRVTSHGGSFKPVSLREVVAQAAELAGLGDIFTGPDVVVQGDQGQLMRMLLNLFANSVKYAHPERPVCVTVMAEPSDGRVVVRVVDNGIGIPEDSLEKVFQLFHRIETTEAVGSGMGLTLARKVAARHGGSINILSDGETGSTVVIELPS